MTTLRSRFRGFLPVVIDVETAGFNPRKDALLELAAITIKMNDQGLIEPDNTYHYHVEPFAGANLDPSALAFNKIDPFHPFRLALPEKDILNAFYKEIQKECKEKNCNRAVIVAHNAWFDHHFLNAATHRANITKNPFHAFTSFDTASLSALIYGQTVLPKALEAARIPYDQEEAHSALYDVKCTAALFCTMVNRWKMLGGWSDTVVAPVGSDEC